jgi:hypothetical protein
MEENITVQAQSPSLLSTKYLLRVLKLAEHWGILVIHIAEEAGMPQDLLRRIVTAK